MKSRSKSEAKKKLPEVTKWKMIRPENEFYAQKLKTKTREGWDYKMERSRYQESRVMCATVT